jgi:diguanylate cyclase (GGDEF)-like protein
VSRRLIQRLPPPAVTLPPLLTVDQVAHAIKRHPEVVRRQARGGRLPAEKIGRGWFFRPERLIAAGYTQFARPEGSFPADDEVPSLQTPQTEEALVTAFAMAVEMRVGRPGRPFEQVRLCDQLSQRIGLPAATRRRVRYTALLQDLGKLGIPDAILRKQGSFDREERAVFMTHPALAADLLGRFEQLAEFIPLVRSHHEWFNGEGYPDGLKGEAIPLETRVVSVVNGFLEVARDPAIQLPDRLGDVFQEMRRRRGTALDPSLTDTFIDLVSNAHRLREPWFAQLIDAIKQPQAPPTGRDDRLTAADSRELQIVYRVAQETRAVLDLDVLLNRIVGIIREIMSYNFVGLLVPDQGTGGLRVGAWSGYEARNASDPIPAGRGVTGWVFAHGLPEIVPDVTKDARYVTLDSAMRSELAFPLISRGRVIGVLNVESDQLNAFGQSDLVLMSAVSSQIASCIEVAQLHASLKQQATLDPLTMVYNRRALMERTDTAIKAGRPFSLLFLDVDHLKQINDTFGHLGGDALLREVASALLDAVRGEDLVARYGGDEFVILLPFTPPQSAGVVGQRIRDGMARHRFLAGRQLLPLPGVSLGTASFPEDGQTTEEVLRAADANLYQQKHLKAG